MERLRVSIDPDVCACTGYCVQVMPALFELDEDRGHTVMLDPQPPLDLLGALREVEALCPTQAIRVEEIEETEGHAP